MKNLFIVLLLPFCSGKPAGEEDETRLLIFSSNNFLTCASVFGDRDLKSKLKSASVKIDFLWDKKIVDTRSKCQKDNLSHTSCSQQGDQHQQQHFLNKNCQVGVGIWANPWRRTVSGRCSISLPCICQICIFVFRTWSNLKVEFLQFFSTMLFQMQNNHDHCSLTAQQNSDHNHDSDHISKAAWLKARWSLWLWSRWWWWSS